MGIRDCSDPCNELSRFVLNCFHHHDGIKRVNYRRYLQILFHLAHIDPWISQHMSAQPFPPPDHQVLAACCLRISKPRLLPRRRHWCSLALGCRFCLPTCSCNQWGPVVNIKSIYQDASILGILDINQNMNLLLAGISVIWYCTGVEIYFNWQTEASELMSSCDP